jgi:hypothetical protein
MYVSRTANEGSVQMVPLPVPARDMSTLPRIDYADAFAVEIAGGLERTPLEWARAILEQAPASFRASAPRTWWALGLRHERPGRPAAVLGWPIRRATDDYALLGADSRTGMPAELLVWRRGPRELLFATLVCHRNAVVRAVWAAITPFHQRVVRQLLERAARRAPR